MRFVFYQSSFLLFTTASLHCGLEVKAKEDQRSDSLSFSCIQQMTHHTQRERTCQFSSQWVTLNSLRQSLGSDWLLTSCLASALILEKTGSILKCQPATTTTWPNHLGQAKCQVLLVNSPGQASGQTLCASVLAPRNRRYR